MYLISACALARFYYGGNLHFNLELEPALNRIKLNDTLTWFSDPPQRPVSEEGAESHELVQSIALTLPEISCKGKHWLPKFQLLPSFSTKSP